MPAAVKERQAGVVTVVEVSGALTLQELAPKLDEKLQSLIARGRLALLVNCSGVKDLDSRGLGVLARGLISVSRRGGKLKLLKISPSVRDALNLTRLSTVMESFDDEESALRSFASSIR